MHGLINCFFESIDDRNYAQEVIRTSVHSKFCLSSLVNFSQWISFNVVRNIALSLALRFLKDDKYPGKISKDVIEHITSYLKAALDEDLNST